MVTTVLGLGLEGGILYLQNSNLTYIYPGARNIRKQANEDNKTGEKAIQLRRKEKNQKHNTGEERTRRKNRTPSAITINRVRHPITFLLLDLGFIFRACPTLLYCFNRLYLIFYLFFYLLFM